MTVTRATKPPRSSHFRDLPGRPRSRPPGGLSTSITYDDRATALYPRTALLAQPRKAQPFSQSAFTATGDSTVQDEAINLRRSSGLRDQRSPQSEDAGARTPSAPRRQRNHCPGKAPVPDDRQPSVPARIVIPSSPVPGAVCALLASIAARLPVPDPAKSHDGGTAGGARLVTTTPTRRPRGAGDDGVQEAERRIGTEHVVYECPKRFCLMRAWFPAKAMAGESRRVAIIRSRSEASMATYVRADRIPECLREGGRTVDPSPTTHACLQPEALHSDYWCADPAGAIEAEARRGIVQSGIVTVEEDNTRSPTRSVAARRRRRGLTVGHATRPGPSGRSPRKSRSCLAIEPVGGP